MCPANGLLEGGSPDTPVDFLCQVAHLRAHLLNLSISPHGECEYCNGGSKYQDLMKSVVELKKKSNSFKEQPGKD